MAWTGVDIAAVAGAAAWLPQVATWGYKWVTKPKLTIIPDKAPEIGYTTYGPIFNLPLALAVDKEDLILTKLGVTLTHENGEKRIFCWQGMAETFSAFRDNLGIERGTFQKDQAAIALKVTKAGLIEKSFRFQEDVFRKKSDPKHKAAIEHLEFLRSKGEDYPNKFLESQPFHELIKSMNELFWWQAGRYQVVFDAESPHNLRISPHSFQFTLQQREIDELRANLANVKDSLEDTVCGHISGYQQRNINWVWKYPSLTTAS